MYHEKKFPEAVIYFERSRALDSSPDMERADYMRAKALAKSSDYMLGAKSGAVNFKRSPGDQTIIRRFGCELCGHFFGKKFNLDRHNRTIHKRDTPEDFPMSPTTEQAEVKTEPTPEPSPVNSFSADDSVPVESAKKKRSKPNPLSAFGSKIRVKCNICKKFFKSGSLARHMIIHTGE